MNISDYAKVLWALCVWREARNQQHAAKLSVAYTVYNRATHPSWWGTDIVSVVLKSKQYSSFNPDDPNAVKLPLEIDTSWEDSLAAVDDVLGGVPDPTKGATHYYDRSLDDQPPTWAEQMTWTADVGAFHFYK